MFVWAKARAYAEQNGYQFICEPWVGEIMFDLHDQRPIPGVKADVIVDGYCQSQEDLIYTQSDCRQWFRFTYQIMDVMDQASGKQVYLHRRAGDYEALGYVVVSWNSYFTAATERQVHINGIFTEENPHRTKDYGYHDKFGDVSWIPDFYLLSTADVLFRGNSSFSWWAATLSHGKVYSPVIEGLIGGREWDCRFVEGNWPRFACLPGITDLHLKP